MSIGGLSKEARETVIGGLVIAALAIVLWMNAADRKVASSDTDSGYDLQAVFQRSEGLEVGAEVRVAGMPVGKVVAQRLDDHYRSHITLEVSNGLQLPTDSAAVIETDGLLGSKYIEIQPGGDEDNLPANGRIEYTQGSMVIEDLLERIVSMAKNRRARHAASPAETSSGADAPDAQPQNNSQFDPKSLIAPLPSADGEAAKGTSSEGREETNP